MKDKSSTELFTLVRGALLRGFEQNTSRETAREALAELERRWYAEETHGASHVSLRLARVEEDLAAFHREHARHVHEIRPFALSTLAVTPGVSGPTAEQIDGMRTNAENRAWKAIEEWITHAPKKPEHSGSTYEVRTAPVSPGHGTDWDAAIWRDFWNEVKDELDSEVVATKRGTSRLDALAHLATWCEEDMHPFVPIRCGAFVADGGAQCTLETDHEGQHTFAWNMPHD